MAQKSKKKKPVWWWGLFFGSPKKSVATMIAFTVLLVSGLWYYALVFALIMLGTAIIFGYRPFK